MMENQIYGIIHEDVKKEKIMNINYERSTLAKSIILLLIGVLLFSCNKNDKISSENSYNKSEIISNEESFDWLLGEWKRNNEEASKETFEIWEKVSSSEYSGIGFTMQNGDTIKQEKIRLIKKNDEWHLIVKVPEESQSIIFNMVEMKSDEFTCKNDSLDFPKLIKYWKNGAKLNALVSGTDLEIQFEFERRR